MDIFIFQLDINIHLPGVLDLRLYTSFIYFFPGLVKTTKLSMIYIDVYVEELSQTKNLNY